MSKSEELISDEETRAGLALLLLASLFLYYTHFIVFFFTKYYQSKSETLLALIPYKIWLCGVFNFFHSFYIWFKDLPW